MPRTWLVCVALSGAWFGCSDNKDPEQNAFLAPVTGTTGDQNTGSNTLGGSTGANGAPTGDASTGDHSGDNADANTGADVDASNASSDVDAGSDAGTPTIDPAVDPNDPPRPTEACGSDLQVHNGRVIPDFGSVPAASEFTGDPIDDGALKVVSEDKTLKNPDSTRNDYQTTAYAPSTDGTTIDAGPFPLIVLVPGFSGNHTNYTHFTDHFVSHGIAVLGVTAANVGFTDTPNNPANVAEILNALDWALTDSELAGKIDMDKLAIAGHSQGGKLAFFTAVTDSRFKLVIGWDPQNGGGAPCFIGGVAGQNCDAWPVAPNCDKDRNFSDPGMLAELRAESIVFAARDTNVTPDSFMWAENFYRGAPSPAHLVLFPNAGHGDWAGAGTTTDITKRVQMALVLSRFFNKTGLDAYSPTGSYLDSEATVDLHTSK